MEGGARVSDRSCNYCTWKALKREYGKRVKLRPDNTKDKLAELYPGSKAYYIDGERSGWFAELPGVCCC